MAQFRCRSFAAVALLVLAPATVAHAERAGTVALTFDDLPVYGHYSSAAEASEITEALLAGLARHRWQVTGFVNEKQLDAPDRVARIDLLARWLGAGMDLGNHSYSHLSLNDVSVETYIADVARDEEVTGGLLALRGGRERWFRYPYLETGPTREIRRRFGSWLAAHGYRVAPVTMNTSDWQFSAPYDAALARGDVRRAEAVRRQYLRFTQRAIAWYQRAGRLLLGREPAFVFLLHASRLNAASIDALANILKRAGLRVVPLDRAMRDPAYLITDRYVGRDGDDWLERWSQTLHRDLPFESMPVVPAGIVAEDARLEAASDPHAATAAAERAPYRGPAPIGRRLSRGW